MTTVRMLIVAVVAAAILGFAAGWWARMHAEPSVEERMHDAEKTVRDRVHDLVH